MIGRTLSHSEIVDEVTRGGMGVVSRTIDVNLGLERGWVAAQRKSGR